MKKNLLLISFFCLLMGSIGYFFYTEKIIILFSKESFIAKNKDFSNKEISLFTWDQKKTYTIEKINIIPTNNNSNNIHHIITCWMNNNNTNNNCCLQRNSISHDGKNIFLHFNHSPFNKNLSIYKKLSWIQGLFKTISEYDNKLKNVYLFKENLPLDDYELDFSHGWNIQGYLK